MYIEQKGLGYQLTVCKTTDCAACIKSPISIEDNREKSADITAISADNCEICYSLSFFHITDKIKQIADGLFEVERDWCNLANERRVQLVFEVETCFLPTKYLIPGVLYNGNKWGKGKEPKGLTYGGKPWIFAYDREGIPSCTIAENKKTAVSVFASDTDMHSLQSSCSLIKTKEGTFLHRIYYPVIEAPLTYSSKDTYSDVYKEYIILKQGEHYKTKSYIVISKPLWENFGLVVTYDRAMELFHMYKPATLQPREIWNLGMAFADKLLMDYEGRKLIVIGLTPDDKDGFYIGREHYEIGWCGQNALYGRIFIKDYIMNGNKESLKKGLSILDAWTEETQCDNGLFYVHFENALQKNTAPSDTCNLGIGATEIAKSYALLKTIGIDKPEYLRFAIHLCDFFTTHFNESYGFGKLWSLNGQCVDSEGTTGGYVIPALIEVYKITGDAVYLNMAEKAIHYYHSRDLSQFVCYAGALDSNCIDKESSGPLLIAAIALYEITDKAAYLEYAMKAAYYFLSWTYHYDVLYPRSSNFEQYGISTSGGTSVSVQHHHIDPWGSSIIPELLKLSKYTKDKKWKSRALSMWNNSLLGIATADGAKICGKKRPLGSQNEGFFHCRWSWDGYISRGRLNHWLVAWPTAFRLSTLDKVSDWTVFESKI